MLNSLDDYEIDKIGGMDYHQHFDYLNWNAYQFHQTPIVNLKAEEKEKTCRWLSQSLRSHSRCPTLLFCIEELIILVCSTNSSSVTPWNRWSHVGLVGGPT